MFNFNIKRNEFLCPLCETIGNTVLPLLPNFKELTNQNTKVIDITFDDWLDGLKNTLDHSIKKELNDDKGKFRVMFKKTKIKNLYFFRCVYHQSISIVKHNEIHGRSSSTKL
jgi:hypothetical protein